MNDTTRRGFIYGAATLVAGGVFLGLDQATRSTAGSEKDPQESAATVIVIRFTDDGKRIGHVTIPKVHKTIEEWRKQLTPGQFAVTRRAGTEEPYSGELVGEHRAGVFRCADCDNALFHSAAKFESGTGWPSFWEPIAPENVYDRIDASLAAARREVKCALCDAHLGHVFTDGPPPTNLRFCVNSVAMKFAPASGRAS